MEPLRIGFLGSGDIAHRVCRAIRPLKEIELYCVASRSRENAAKLASEFGFQKVCDSYEALLEDPKVDLVYNGLLHPLHHPYAMKCLEASKPLLCEKPFAMNMKQACEMVEGFRRRGLFLGEALWTRFLPARRFVEKALAEGTIGQIVLADVNMICNIVHRDRMTEPELGGGALLDLGIYALNFVDMFLGLDYSEMDTLCNRYATGVDDTELVILRYPEGRLASCKISMSGCGDARGILYGTKGRIEVDDVMNFHKVSVYDGQNTLVDEFNLEADKIGYEYEFLACQKTIAAGKTELEDMPLDATLCLMRQLDKLLETWGVDRSYVV